jgi:anaerobic magnesium-protoporphyrin IX monomethyl ester cyclase
MKILLIDPPGKNKGINTGLGYLSAVLKENHEVLVLDLNNIEMGLCGDPNPDMKIDELETRIIKAVDDFDPELFGVSVKTFTAEISKHIFKLIKAQRPEILAVAGGPHITLDGFRFIQKNKIDFGIQGEGEYSTPKLCDALKGLDRIENIEGLFYWKGDQLSHNPRHNTIKDLDAIPLPCYDNFSSIIINGGFLKEYPILTSRGCPYNCSYCSMPTIMGGKWRPHSSERVIHELQHAKDKYHSTSFTVVDDNFTLNLKRVEDICDQLISNQIHLPWNSQNGIRADRINAYLAEKMKHSGCHYVWIGIESADEKVFNSINKGEKLEHIKEGIKHLRKAGIRVGGFFIVGLPYSTKEADLKSVDFVKKLGIDGWWFNFVPYPHTKAWDWVQTHGKILRSSNGALQFGTNSIEPVFETGEYPKESRIEAYNEIHVKLKYFDRLADSSLTLWSKWKNVFTIVAPYGFGSILSLLIFILKYNIKLAVNNLRR